MVGRAIRAIVLGWDVIDGPQAGRIASVADGYVDRVLAVVVGGCANVVKRGYRGNETLVVRVIVTDWVDYIRSIFSTIDTTLSERIRYSFLFLRMWCRSNISTFRLNFLKYPFDREINNWINTIYL